MALMGGFTKYMTAEQQQVFEQSVSIGLARDMREAYELGAANLRPRLEEAKAKDKADADAAALAEAEETARRQPSLF